MHRRYTYQAYVLIPETVRREFTVQEIRLLRICPVGTLPKRDPYDPAVAKTPMLAEKECVVCGILFKRLLLANEDTFEKATCGAVRCVDALYDWMVDAIPITKSAKNSEEELLTFLRSRIYHFSRTKWLQRHKIKLVEKT